MLIGFKFISGFMVGLEFNFDINSLIFDLGIIRIAFVFPQKENDPY